MARKLAALAGLGALGHLDLHHVGIDQILGGDAEPARRDLLDGGAHGIAVRQRLVAIGFLAALARIRLAADAIHRNRKRGMGLARNRTKRHGSGGEAPYDVSGGLDLLKRHRRAAVLSRGLEAEHAADGEQPLRLLVADLGVGPVLVERIAAHCVLKRRHGGGVPDVILTAHPVGVLAADVEGVAIDG